MKVLPNEDIKLVSECAEKIKSYLILANYNMPVLNSVYITRDEIDNWEKIDTGIIRKHLKSDWVMLRYIYQKACYMIKNGGTIVPLKKENIQAELPIDADAWLLEPIPRTENRYCYNLSLDKNTENMHMEILGSGFDISDLNKGIMSPHEILDMPFPFEEGNYGEWWKWIKIHICDCEEYQNSILIRKERLRIWGEEVEIPDKFIPMDRGMLEKIKGYINSLIIWFVGSAYTFINISCSILKNGRFVFWDIQTPEGKTISYF